MQRILGNTYAGTFRRVWESRQVSADTDERHLEAYWWGGLTSGNWRRALWLLLLPFMLLNVAYFMTAWTPPDRSAGPGGPQQPGQGGGPAGSSRGQHRVLVNISEGAQRALALTLTVTMTLLVITIAMDLAGWQCSREAAHCQGKWGPGLLNQSTLAAPGRRLAASALAPLAMVALLWWQGRKTWKLAESVAPKGAPASPQGWVSPLEDRALWNGQRPVARLRALHIAAALATIAVFLSAPFIRDPRGSVIDLLDSGWGSRGRGASTVVLVAAVGVLLLCAVLCALPRYERPRPDMGRAETHESAPLENVLTAASGVLLVVAGVQACRLVPGTVALAPRGLTTRQPAPLTGQLPWLNAVSLATFVVQLLLLFVIWVCARRLATCWRKDPLRASAVVAAEEAPAPQPEPPKLAWCGLGPLMFAGMAWVLLGGLAAAFIWRSAAAFGNPQGPGQEGNPNDAAPLYLGWQYFWAALGALVLALALLVAAAGAYLRLRMARTVAAEQVQLAYQARLPSRGSEDTPEGRAALKRRDELTKVWANAQLERTLKKTLTLVAWALVVIVVGGAAAGFVVYGASPEWPLTAWRRQLVTLGGLVLTAAVLSFLWVGRQAYSNDKFRRSVGILWDLGTFWPRATHPLAPPCYAERAIPDLLRRVECIDPSGQTVLSAHSQGTVIAVATIAQMSSETARNVSLVTYGSPLRRLYAQYFPAYFGVPALLRTGQLLSDDPSAAADWTKQARGRWPWLNLYRLSDPIGGHIFLAYPATESRGILEDLWKGCPPDGIDELPVEQQLERILVELAERRRQGGEPPLTFDNGDVDWQLVDPRFARENGDAVWPRPDGHSRYPADPAFAYALALAWRRRGPWVAAGQARATASESPGVAWVWWLRERWLRLMRCLHLGDDGQRSCATNEEAPR